MDENKETRMATDAKSKRREEGELDETLDASVSEPGVNLVLPCDVVVERSITGRLDALAKPTPRSSNVPQSLQSPPPAGNAGVPGCVKTQRQLSVEIELDKLHRNLLNRYPPRREFSQLLPSTSELISASATSPDTLQVIVDMIYERVIADLRFSVLYSHLCRTLASVNVPNAGNPGKPITFKFLLISKVQEEFEKKHCAPTPEQIKQKYDEINAEPNEEKRVQMRAEVDDVISVARCRSVGNSKFIGELFHVYILTDTIVYFCLQKYLRERDDTSLECLCKLLTTIGKKLESNRKFKGRLNEVFYRAQKIVDEKACSVRVQSLLQDVLDLRLNDWKPQREEDGSKAIDQLLADDVNELKSFIDKIKTIF